MNFPGQKDPHFFETPRSARKAREDQYWPPEQPFGNEWDSVYTNGRGENIVQPSQPENICVQVVERTDDGITDVIDSGGLYKVKLLSTWFLADDDPAFIPSTPTAPQLELIFRMSIPDDWPALPAGTRCIAQWWNMSGQPGQTPFPHSGDAGRLAAKMIMSTSHPVTIEIVGEQGVTAQDEIPDWVFNDHSCVWKAVIVRTPRSALNDCDRVEYDQTDQIDIYACTKTRYNTNVDSSSGNRPLIQIGERYDALFLGMFSPQDTSGTGPKKPLYIIKTENFGKIIRTIPSGNNDGKRRSLQYDGKAWFAGKEMLRVVDGLQVTDDGTGGEILDVRYGVQFSDTLDVELLGAGGPGSKLIPVRLKRSMSFPGCGDASESFQYEWTYANRGVVGKGGGCWSDSLTYGGLLPTNGTLDHVQDADSVSVPEIYIVTIDAGGNTAVGGDRSPGGVFKLNGNVFSYGASHATLQAALTNFTVTGTGTALSPYILTGVDASPHSLAIDGSGLTPSTAMNPATFMNVDTDMDTPVYALLIEDSPIDDGTNTVQTFTVVWSNGNKCTNAFGGQRAASINGYDASKVYQMLGRDSENCSVWIPTEPCVAGTG